MEASPKNIPSFYPIMWSRKTSSKAPNGKSHGEVTHEYPNLGLEYQFPFTSNAYYVVLSAQLGGDWVGEIDLKGETVYMSIDWVRIYYKK